MSKFQFASSKKKSNGEVFNNYKSQPVSSLKEFLANVLIEILKEENKNDILNVKNYDIIKAIINNKDSRNSTDNQTCLKGNDNNINNVNNKVSPSINDKDDKKEDKVGACMNGNKRNSLISEDDINIFDDEVFFKPIVIQPLIYDNNNEISANDITIKKSTNINKISFSDKDSEINKFKLKQLLMKQQFLKSINTDKIQVKILQEHLKKLQHLNLESILLDKFNYHKATSILPYRNFNSVTNDNDVCFTNTKQPRKSKKRQLNTTYNYAKKPKIDFVCTTTPSSSVKSKKINSPTTKEISTPPSTITSPTSTITSPTSTITSPTSTITLPTSTITLPTSTITLPTSTITSTITKTTPTSTKEKTTSPTSASTISTTIKSNTQSIVRVQHNHHKISSKKSNHLSPSIYLFNSSSPLSSHHHLSNNMQHYYNINIQTLSQYRHKMMLRDIIFLKLKEIFPQCGLYVTGSSMNGFGITNCDMDLCMMLTHQVINQQTEACNLLTEVSNILMKCDFIKRTYLIKAKVPILKFKDTISGVDCDLNINNSEGIRNTHLLNAYCLMDPRVAPLVLYVKNWAKEQDISGANTGRLSSYSLVLMVIHYLQCGCKPFLLPSLQVIYPQKFNSNVDLRQLSLKDNMPTHFSRNQHSLGALFSGFLHYFAHVFSFPKEVMCVRMGRKINRVLFFNNTPIENQAKSHNFIWIEEPFTLNNTASSVHHYRMYENILSTFRTSSETFSSLRIDG